MLLMIYFLYNFLSNFSDILLYIFFKLYAPFPQALWLLGRMFSHEVCLIWGGQTSMHPALWICYTAHEQTCSALLLHPGQDALPPFLVTAGTALVWRRWTDSILARMPTGTWPLQTLLSLLGAEVSKARCVNGVSWSWGCHKEVLFKARWGLHLLAKSIT